MLHLLTAAPCVPQSAGPVPAQLRVGFPPSPVGNIQKAFRVYSKERKTRLVPVQGRSAEIQQLNPTFLQLRDSLMRD